jgi:phosphatidylserine/phosphatidylglycerophosphate/cardiolipin synthase-like enzyme
MPIKQLQQTLLESYADFRLSTDEKYELKQLLNDVKQDIDNLNFVRNRAFSIVADNYRSSEAEHIASLSWLEKVMKTIDSIRNNTSVISSSYFSPGVECASKIIALLDRAKHSIKICVFTISDNNITKAIFSAHERGVIVQIISDNDKANDKGSDIYQLNRQEVSIRIDQSSSHMHHKYAIIDDDELINGSFNWTRSASKYNQENIVVTNDKTLINSFNGNFEKLWQSCVVIQ